MQTYNNGHQKIDAKCLDHKVLGQYYACHSEKKAATNSKNKNGKIGPIGISAAMCPDCQLYFREEASTTRISLYTADPDGVHIFRSDGSTIGANFSRES